MRVENISNIYKLISVPFHPARHIGTSHSRSALSTFTIRYLQRARFYIHPVSSVYCVKQTWNAIVSDRNMPIISMCGRPEVMQKGSKNPYIRTICRSETSGRTTSKVSVLGTSKL